MLYIQTILKYKEYGAIGMMDDCKYIEILSSLGNKHTESEPEELNDNQYFEVDITESYGGRRIGSEFEDLIECIYIDKSDYGTQIDDMQYIPAIVIHEINRSILGDENAKARYGAGTCIDTDTHMLEIWRVSRPETTNRVQDQLVTMMYPYGATKEFVQQFVNDEILIGIASSRIPKIGTVIPEECIKLGDDWKNLIHLCDEEVIRASIQIDIHYVNEERANVDLYCKYDIGNKDIKILYKTLIKIATASVKIVLVDSNRVYKINDKLQEPISLFERHEDPYLNYKNYTSKIEFDTPISNECAIDIFQTIGAYSYDENSTSDARAATMTTELIPVRKNYYMKQLNSYMRIYPAILSSIDNWGSGIICGRIQLKYKIIFKINYQTLEVKVRVETVVRNVDDISNLHTNFLCTEYTLSYKDILADKAYIQAKEFLKERLDFTRSIARCNKELYLHSNTIEEIVRYELKMPDRPKIKFICTNRQSISTQINKTRVIGGKIINIGTEMYLIIFKNTLTILWVDEKRLFYYPNRDIYADSPGTLGDKIAKTIQLSMGYNVDDIEVQICADKEQFRTTITED